jgi:hypothetical protein
MGALGSPLGPHTESDLATYLYFGSTPIAIMDESDHRISFNYLKKSVTSLPMVIGAFGSPLVPHPESDLAIDLYSGSTPIANMDEFDRRISFNQLSPVIGASDSPLGLHPERDLAIDLHSGSTLIPIKDESNRRIRYR